MKFLMKFLMKNTPGFLYSCALLVALQAFIPLNIFAQNDATAARTSVYTINFNFDSTVIGTDSITTLQPPARSVIERVIWSVDTALKGIDSLQLRAGESQTVVATCVGSVLDGLYSAVQLSEPVRAFLKSETLRVIPFASEGLAGQVRVFIIWRELN